MEHEDAILAEHHDVEQDHLRLDAGTEVDAGDAVVGHLDPVAVAPEERGVVAGRGLVVLDDHQRPRALSVRVAVDRSGGHLG